MRESPAVSRRSKVERKGRAAMCPRSRLLAGFTWPRGRMGRKQCHEMSLPEARYSGVSCLVMKAQGTQAFQGPASVTDTGKIILAANLNSHELHQELQV